MFLCPHSLFDYNGSPIQNQSEVVEKRKVPAIDLDLERVREREIKRERECERERENVRERENIRERERMLERERERENVREREKEC